MQWPECMLTTGIELMLWFAFEEKSFNFKHFINQVCLAVLILTENAGIIQTDMISEVIMTIFYEFFSFLF